MALEAERQRASFSITDLRTLLHGSEAHYEQRRKLEVLLDKPLFDKTDDPYLSRPDYVKLCARRSFETYRLLKSNRELLKAHSPLHGEGGMYIGGFGTPTGLTDHFALFINTLLLQGTKEQQKRWLWKAVKLEIIGTYAQTEIGHGSNVRGLETTATYDEATDEFVIDSPTVSSAKWWPGALGLLATHAAIYARLIIKGKDHGFTCFIVQIRDEAHKPLPGVEVGDLGPKMGYNSYDNGYLLLHQVRVPRFNMLAKFQQVESGGAFREAPKGLQKIAYMTMLRTRVLIAAGAGISVAKILTIAVRYNAARLQGFKEKKGGEENYILDYPVQQDRLFPGIAAAFCFHFTSVKLISMCAAFEAKLKETDGDDSVDAGMLPTLHGMSTGLKAFSTELSAQLIEEARKACGGHGYTLSSGIGLPQLTALPSITYEGDLVPMALQCARFLVGCLQMMQKGHKMPSPVAYLEDEDDETKLPSTVDDFLNPTKMVALLQAAARNAIVAAAMQVLEDIEDKKMARDKALAANAVALMHAAYVHTMAFIAKEMAETAQGSGGLATVLGRLCVMFVMSQVARVGTAHHRLAPDAAAEMEKARMQLIAAIRPDAVGLVEAWAFTDKTLCSTIGSYDNSKMYEAMMEHTKRNPLNTAEYQSAFHSEILSDFLNKEALKSRL